MVDLRLGDCLELMKDIPDGSVDLVLTDPPYVSGKGTSGDITGNVPKVQTKNDGKRYPRSIQKFCTEKSKSKHPTQKPIALLEYLIRTYTNEGETVLDFTMGSGSTGVACVINNRNFTGIELDDGYFEIAKRRIEEAQAQSRIET